MAEWLKRPTYTDLIKGKIRRFDSCWMHLERSVQSQLTEFIHIFIHFLACTYQKEERSLITDIEKARTL